MAGPYTLDDLNTITEVADDDLLHVRNTSGLDKSITMENLTTDVLGYVNHVRRTEFLVETAGWCTLFRTQKNFSGFIKVSGYANNLRDFFTLSVYGDEDAGAGSVGFIEQSLNSSIDGITKIRWGDAGAGNGMCVQLYVDPDTDDDVRIKAVSWGGQPAHSSTGHGFVFETTATDNEKDFDSNTVSTWTRTYYRAAFGELIRSNQYRSSDLQDIVVDGTTVTRVEPGVYNSIHFTGDGEFGPGSYLVMDKLTIDTGITASVARFEGVQVGTATQAFLVTTATSHYRPWAGQTPGTAQGAKLLNDNVSPTVALCFGQGKNGGGNGGMRGSGATASITVGGGGPCSYKFLGLDYSSSSIYRPAIPGIGHVMLNILGTLENSGSISADGEDGLSAEMWASSWGAPGGSGGAVLIRTLSTGSTWGTISVGGGDGFNATYGGPGGAGGVADLYDFGTITATATATAGTNGTGGTTIVTQTDGSVFKIDLTAQPDKVTGGSDVVTNDEYLYAGNIIKSEGGWWNV